MKAQTAKVQNGTVERGDKVRIDIKTVCATHEDEYLVVNISTGGNEGTRLKVQNTVTGQHRRVLDRNARRVDNGED